MHIAVLGAGLTGLSSAFHLSRKFPNALILILEKQARLGGWVHSERVQVDGIPGGVLLESGPRTVRPGAKSVQELIHLLKLEKDLILSPQSVNTRFLHIPGTSGLTQLTNSLLGWYSAPYRPRLPSISRLQLAKDDKSFDEVVTRLLGPEFARVVGSAFAHGVYAADSRVLSWRALRSIYKPEPTLKNALKNMLLPNWLAGAVDNEYELGRIPRMLKGVSVYSFRDGIGTLIDGLVNELKNSQNVTFITESQVSSLKITSDNTIEISTRNGPTINPSHVVSTIAPPVLSRLVAPSSIPHLTANPYSSVTVVNLVFPTSPSTKIHPDGFGYLIPRSEAKDPYASGPGILGTVFDSCALSAQDSDGRNFTKMTVMVGGPFNKHSKTSPPAIDVQDILKHVSRHLQVKLPEPIYTRVVQNDACIPTYTVGHRGRMEKMVDVLKTGPWKGRLEVIGAGVGGVSLGDCVDAGKRAGNDW